MTTKSRQVRPDELVIVFVRHARAEARGWRTRHDKARRLTRHGVRQALRLSSGLGDLDLLTAVSSPARRCLETIHPFVDASGIGVVTSEAFARGRSVRGAFAELERYKRGVIVVCTHGEMLNAIRSRLPSGYQRSSTMSLRTVSGNAFRPGVECLILRRLEGEERPSTPSPDRSAQTQ